MLDLNIQNFSSYACNVFNQTIDDYHVYDDLNQTEKNPYEKGQIQHLLYSKCWIDTIQWHLEDIIRIPDISPIKGMEIKRLIDQSNQKRTDTVEALDLFFDNVFQNIKPKKKAYHNTETPAWAIDRLSILTLRIYHMKEECHRLDASKKHVLQCNHKLNILLVQQDQLMLAIDQLLEFIYQGNIIFKPFAQMKMYNDENLNPSLYTKNKN
ncbi:MAG: DUF4254 domain-containing protein [Flavobacteriaceae bacterium]|nr:DUF4254 domain-containing protein [Flavobacteriaceae bacterium]MCY4267212.1 DUF4254 domain-containing protein [Flavobacteriaceae bacterium]MCY4298172.1 DUF4254 domain-containing protein [Flavobacteriaceae bacterium]